MGQNGFSYVWGNCQLMGMPVMSTVERLAGIRATARRPNSQAIIDATHSRRGGIHLEGRNDPCPFSYKANARNTFAPEPNGTRTKLSGVLSKYTATQVNGTLTNV